MMENKILYKKPLRLTLSTQIVHEMEKCIKDEVWKIGEKIPAEAELVEEFAVSRNTIREATQSLVFAGILQPRPGEGTYVIAKGRLEAVMQKQMRQTSMDNILETRYALESHIVRFASLRRTEEELVSLKDALVKRDDPSLNRVDFVKADVFFHLNIAALCHNTLLYNVYASIMSHLEELVDEFLGASGDNRQFSAHHNLYKAIEDGNPDEAVRIVAAMMNLEKDSFYNDMLKNHVN